MKLTYEKRYYSAIVQENFYKYTRVYNKGVIQSMNKAHSKFMMIAQLVPLTNMSQYLGNIDNIKVFLVDRYPFEIKRRHRKRNYTQ